MLKITNAPTKRAMPLNESRKIRMIFRNPLMSFWSALACSEPVLTTAVGGTIARSSETSFADETPGRAATAIAS